MTVTSVPRPKAERLAELLPTYSTGTSKQTGQRFYVVPSSNRLSAHWTAVDGSGCTCRGYQYRGTCTHADAAKLLDRQSRQVAGAEHAPTASPTSWRPCSRGCGELLSPEHVGKSCDACWSKLAGRLDFLEG